MDSTKKEPTAAQFAKCVKMIRQLVSDIQGAPYPGEQVESELYKIWYEHVQKAAVECFEFLDENFPLQKTDFRGVEKLIDSGK
ncbi:MAG: hypothetical protein IJ717_11935 [Treponema sp.]|nr:hypothetical protein [Treponema sp.]MBR1715637.1 hypothetical protein [Treponema sp.]